MIFVLCETSSASRNEIGKITPRLTIINTTEFHSECQNTFCENSTLKLFSPTKVFFTVAMPFHFISER